MDSNIGKEEYNNFILGEDFYSEDLLPFENGINTLLSFPDRLDNPPFPNNSYNSLSLNFEDLGEYMADKIINLNKSNKKEETLNEKVFLNSKDKIEKLNKKNKEKNEELKKKEIIENNIPYQNGNKNIFKVYPKKEHNKYNRDNIIDKIIRNFLNNIYEACNYEIIKMKKRDTYFSKYKLFTKITSILVFLKKLKIEEIFKLKTKNIFYSDNILEIFNLNKKQFKEKYIEKKKENNINNKKLIKNLEEEKKRIDEIKDEEIKKSILNINEIMNKSLYDIPLIYLLDDKKYESFKTLTDDIIELEKDGEDEKYLKKYENVAKILLNKIDENDALIRE